MYVETGSPLAERACSLLLTHGLKDRYSPVNESRTGVTLSHLPYSFKYMVLHNCRMYRRGRSPTYLATWLHDINPFFTNTEQLYAKATVVNILVDYSNIQIFLDPQIFPRPVFVFIIFQHMKIERSVITSCFLVHYWFNTSWTQKWKVFTHCMWNGLLMARYFISCV